MPIEQILTALGIVAGALITASAVFAIFKRWLDERDKKRDAQKAEESSLKANWGKTDKHEESIEMLKGIVEELRDLTCAIVNRSSAYAPVEQLKTASIKLLLDESGTQASTVMRESLDVELQRAELHMQKLRKRGDNND